MRWGKILLVVFATFHFSGQSFAQDQEDLDEEKSGYTDDADAHFTKNVRISPLSLNLGTVTVYLDFGVSDTITIGPRVGFLRKTVSEAAGDVALTANEIGAHVKIYLTSKRFKTGWTLEPFASFLVYSISQGDGERKPFGGALGLNVSYQWFWHEGFNLAFGIGGTYYTLKNDIALSNGASVEAPSFSGIIPSVEFNIGYAF